MRTRRRHERIIKRLEVEFSANEQTNRGISSNFSLGGLFIRTNRVYAPGTAVELLIHFPDGTSSHSKGIVRMSRLTPVSPKNGMGIEITEKDEAYAAFMKSILPDIAETGGVAASAPADIPSSTLIVTCPACGVKNRVRAGSTAVRCGRCGTTITTG